MTAIEQRALAILRNRPGLTASALGWELWGESTEAPNRGDGSHGTNKFCRAAGRLRACSRIGERSGSRE